MNERKLQEFVGKALTEMGAGMNVALVVIGDKLGLYKAMAGAGGLTSAELAKRTGTNERYVREWLNAQAAGGYVTYDPATKTYTLPPEQASCLADESATGVDQATRLLDQRAAADPHAGLRATFHVLAGARVRKLQRGTGEGPRACW